MNMVKRGKQRRQKSWGELEWVERIRKMAAPQAGGGSVVIGIGDDCAVFRPRGSSEDLLFTTDMLIEDVHFRCDTHSAADVGWKTLARGLSDIAAMGGAPRFALLSLALPAWAGKKWIDGFYRGFLELAEWAGAPLIGGDLARSEKVYCDIVVCGAAARGKALRRDGARAGDAVYVSGDLGASALGLATQKGAPWRIHRRPRPRLALGKLLTRLGATAAMDLSDGLSLDLKRMCLASGLSAEIGAPPLFRGATEEQALHGGEDYELLFTVPKTARVPGEFEGVRLTRIGEMRRGEKGLVLLNGEPLAARGYDHLKKN
jgi:thiamine-monophosphate kinase